MIHTPPDLEWRVAGKISSGTAVPSISHYGIRLRPSVVSVSVLLAYRYRFEVICSDLSRK